MAGSRPTASPVRATLPRLLAAFAASAVLGGAFLWAAGSIYSRSADLPSSLRLGSAMQMLTGGTSSSSDR